MLAIDTNLIVRYLVGDDAGQAARARRLIDNNGVFVCTTVLLETEWVLRSVYRFSAAQCAKSLSDFAGLPRASLEDAAAVAKALGWMRQCLDLADGLHLAKAKAVRPSSASTRISPRPPTPLAASRCGRPNTERAERM
jgi:predicted nucleic-acid-binding protein